MVIFAFIRAKCHFYVLFLPLSECKCGEGGVDRGPQYRKEGIYIRLIQPRCPREGWQGPSLLAAYLGRVISPLITHCCSALLSLIIIIAIVIIIIIITRPKPAYGRQGLAGS